MDALRLAFERVCDGVVVVDGNGIVVAANPAARSILGVGPDDLVGRPAAEALATWFDPADEYLSPAESPVAVALGDRHVEWRVVSPEDGVGCLIVMHDATALKRVQRSKDEFVSFVSHELRIPMTSIKGYTDLLLTGAVGPVNEAQTQFLHTVRTNVNRLASQIEAIVDSSRIESGSLYIERVPISLRNAIESAVNALEKQIAEKQQVLDVELSPTPMVLADQKRLVQVIAALLDNAHKYTPEGGHIVVRTGLTDDGSRVQISVSDDGIGIAPNDQARIFEKFFRSEDQEVRNVPGFGLALYIARGLLAALGGHIWFESTLREGTTFHFTLVCAETG